jgi:predicted metal-dependent hydrolase
MTEPYDARYLAGIEQFNRQEYFDAHEVWEDLWRDSTGPEAGFYKGLIQASVCLYHLGRGNLAGARRLFASGRAYMLAAGSPFLGLDVQDFWRQMGAYFAAQLEGAAGDVPQVRLVPHPGPAPGGVP